MSELKPLKPCPFCGSDAAIFVKDDASFPYRVQCLDDDCASRTDSFKQYSFAIKAWNMRVKDEKKGKWVDKSGGIEGAWNYCSVCGEQAIDLYDFCPNCGSYNGGDKNDRKQGG